MAKKGKKTYPEGLTEDRANQTDSNVGELVKRPQPLSGRIHLSFQTHALQGDRDCIFLISGTRTLLTREFCTVS